MSIIESLLLNIPEDRAGIKNSRGKSGFLSELLKSYKNDPGKLKDIFKNLGLNEKDLEKISAKNPEDKELKKIITGLKTMLKTQDKNPAFQDNRKPEDVGGKLNGKNTDSIENDNAQADILKKLINETPVSNRELEKKFNRLFKNKPAPENHNKNGDGADGFISPDIINTLSSEGKTALEEKIVNIAKKMITSRHILEKTKSNEGDIQKFKEIKTFRELVDFANKKELNISKIIISYEKKETDTGMPLLPKNKIELKNVLKKNIKFNTENTAETKPCDILSSLIQKTENPAGRKTDFNIGKHNLNGKNKNSAKQDSRDIHIQNGNPGINELKQNILKAKHSVRHFAQNLKEAVENYRPPVSKLSMELHPKELGKVEVTLIHRGESLQIQINSNNTAVNFLHSQQQELRQNLINMGFTDVNMSFNQQQEQGNRQYRQNQKMNGNNEDGDELVIEIPYQYA